MSLNDTPAGERLHIGFFGRMNAGKSSVVNAVTGQELAIVSPTRGTTTDPVLKAMELLPLGPVVIIDTPGFDDEGPLGTQRVSKTRRVLNMADMAVLIVDATIGLTEQEADLVALFQAKGLPYVLAYNKADLLPTPLPAPADDHIIYVSALTGDGIEALKDRLGAMAPDEVQPLHLVADFIEAGDTVVLVVPIDKAAPKGRLILPQQQAIRDILDAQANALVVQVPQLKAALHSLQKPPALVITDSQVFPEVAAIVPPELPLTSFSILMARYKGLLKAALPGVLTLQALQDGDTVLIAEGCTHHRQCNDIGTVKIPAWLSAYTGKQLKIATCSGRSFPEDLKPYAMVIHCGGCMLTEREMRYRMQCALDQDVPITNYGLLIAFLKGILPRATALPGLLAEMDSQRR